MYIQITERCNMACPHCCFSCGPNTGSHMSKKTFVQAISLCEKFGSYPTIGGGEPTVHPHFWDFVGHILSRSHCLDMEGFAIITNGKRTSDAMALAALAKSGILSADLSIDRYHEQVDPSVKQAFTRKSRLYGYDSCMPRDNENDRRSIRTVSEILSVGRGKDIAGASQGCPCSELFVDVKGNLWGCGCKDFPMGTVFAPVFPKGYEDTGECMSRINSLVEEEA